MKMEYYDPIVRAFPDVHVEIEEITANDDFVIARWLAMGTHRGEIFGVPPSGEQLVKIC